MFLPRIEDRAAAATYLLKGFYIAISGKYARSDEASNGASIVEIYGDGKLLYASPEMTRGSEPIAFDVNIIGVNKLAIGTKWAGYSSFDSIGQLWDVTLTEIKE